MTRASTGTVEKWVEGIATQTKIQKIIYSNNTLSIYEWRELEGTRTTLWVEIFCFVSQSKMFQPYFWQQILTKKLTYDRAPMIPCHRHFVGLNCHWMNTWIFWSCMPPLFGVEFPPQVRRCATGIFLDLWSEGRWFEPRCLRAIMGVPLMVRRFKAS